MRRFLMAWLAIGFGLYGCGPFGSPPDDSARKAREAQEIAISQKLLHAWVDCARASYKDFETTMVDKNEAAERALQACQSEELDFRQTSPEILFPHTREAVKQILIGHEAW